MLLAHKNSVSTSAQRSVREIFQPILTNEVFGNDESGMKHDKVTIRSCTHRINAETVFQSYEGWGTASVVLNESPHIFV